jgi:hypothetical protein
LTKDDLKESSTWSSPPFLFLRDIHSKFLTQNDCKEVCAPSQSQVHVGASGGISSQDGVSFFHLKDTCDFFGGIAEKREKDRG